MDSRRTITPPMAEELARTVTGLTLPLRINWKSGGTIDCEEYAKRTTNQNSLLHKNFTEIAKFHGDREMIDVKGVCHVDIGVPIRTRDDNQFAWVWDRLTQGMTYEQKCKLCQKEILAVSSGMTTKQLAEYINALQAEYLPRGAMLTQPEDR